MPLVLNSKVRVQILLLGQGPPELGLAPQGEVCRHAAVLEERAVEAALAMSRQAHVPAEGRAEHATSPTPVPFRSLMFCVDDGEVTLPRPDSISDTSNTFPTDPA